MGVLRPKQQDKESVRITATIPVELSREIDEVKAAAEARGYEFPVGEIVTDALRKAVKQAKRQLAQGGNSNEGAD